MKKRVLWILMATAFLICSTATSTRLEAEEELLLAPTGIIPEVKVISFGKKDSFKVSQTAGYPLDMGNYLIICLGTGTLKITCKNSDEGRLFFIAGCWFDTDSNLLEPFIQFGYGNTSIIGKFRFADETHPLAYAWITSAILLATGAEDALPYEYSIELELS